MHVPMTAAPTASMPSPSQSPPKSSIERMRELKSMFDDGLVTQVEYDEKRAKILEQL